MIGKITSISIGRFGGEGLGVSWTLCVIEKTILVTVNGVGPLGREVVQLKSVKIFTFVTKIEISNISLSILKQ